MTSPAASSVPDFSKPAEPITFTCDGDAYKAPRYINPIALKRVLTAVSGIDLSDQQHIIDNIETLVPKIADILRALVPGPGGARLARRMMLNIPKDDVDENAEPTETDSEQPLDIMNQAMPILVYLMEQLGLRPTVPSSDFSAGSMAGTTATPNGGMPSTDGESLTESATTN